MACVSIAYAENYKVRVGVVYNPFLDELFYAAENSGAFLNGQRIRVKDVSALETCLTATGFPYVKDDAAEIMRRLGRVWPKVRDLRRLGSAALDICWVACGRLQAYYEGQLNPWTSPPGNSSPAKPAPRSAISRNRTKRSPTASGAIT